MASRPQSDQSVQLSLVVPVYNFEGRVAESLSRMTEALRDSGLCYELIWVNDGSDDLTHEELHRLQSTVPQMRVVSYPVNRGKGYAVKQGMLQAEGRFVFFTDADLPYGIGPVLEGINRLETEAPIVCGSRDLAESRPEVPYPPLRRLTHWLFSRLANSLFDTGISDTQCGLKGFRAETAHTLFRDLILEDFAFDVELLYRARQEAHAIALVPVSLRHSPSSFSVLPATLQMLASMLRLSWRLRKTRDPQTLEVQRVS